MLKKKIYYFILSFTLVLSLFPGMSCLAQEDCDIDTFAKKVEAIDGISDVTVVNDTTINAYIEQPLDWQSDTGKTFKQQFNIKYAANDVPTCYVVSGYTIQYSNIESAVIRNSYTYNAVEIEYRYFGKSIPDGLDNDSVELWEYLTVENAANDIHALIEKLSTLLTGKRMMTGSSKGGFTTNMQAYLYPDDCDLFMSFCAPLCENESDPRMYEFLNNTVGDDVLGKEEAKECRDLILDFQVECMRYKDDLKIQYKNIATGISQEGEKNYRPVLMEDDGGKLFDVALIDFQASVWMSQSGAQDYSTIDGLKSTLKNVLDMPSSTEEEVAAKEKEILRLLVMVCYPGGYACSKQNSSYPYLVQSAMQMGNNAADLSPLRERIEEEQKIDSSFPDLSITLEEEKTNMMSGYLTEEQIEMASKFDFVYDELMEWSKTTTANVVMIFGAVDPWYATAIPENDNPNIQYVVVKSSDRYRAFGHSIGVPSYDEESQKVIYDAVDALFQPDPVNTETPQIVIYICYGMMVVLILSFFIKPKSSK